jgi:hypothetical protein
MDVEKLCRQALDVLSKNYELPGSGFLAGGSLSNIIWEFVSGNKAHVNDIDIFILDSEIEYSDYISEKFTKPLFEKKVVDKKYLEEYSSISWISETKKYIRIIDSRTDSDINYIKYVSNTSDPLIVLNSFDINCVCVGYSIDNDKFYWTDEFVYFLKTGQLKILNLKTPSHTAIRIAKKRKELNSKLDEFEIKLLQHVIEYEFDDIFRLSFKERYYNLYHKHSDYLNEYFSIEIDSVLSDYIRDKYLDKSNVWRLVPVKGSNYNKLEDIFNINTNIFFNTDHNINKIFNTDDFLFYMRNIFGDQYKSGAWSRVRWFFTDSGYIDTELPISDLELLNNISNCIPNCIENLKGYTISCQISIIKRLFEKFSHNMPVFVSILSKIRLDPSLTLNEQDCLLLELSVRKESRTQECRKKVKLVEKFIDNLKSEI